MRFVCDVGRVQVLPSLESAVLPLPTCLTQLPATWCVSVSFPYAGDQPVRIENEGAQGR